jgi:hypothetical protein
MVINGYEFLVYETERKKVAGRRKRMWKVNMKNILQRLVMWGVDLIEWTKFV